MGMDLIAIAGNVLLFSLVFGMSATVDIQGMRKQLRNCKAIATGVACQFFVLPLLGFLVVFFMDLEPSLGIPLLVVTSSPGGSYSNWWCSMFNGDLALSVTMTAISTILSIVLLPLNLLLYSKFSYQADVLSQLDWTSVFIALAVVIVAIVVGLLGSYRFNSLRFNQTCNQLGNISGLCLIIFSATMTNSGDADTKIWSRGWEFYVGVMLPCLGGLILSNIFASLLKLKAPERVTVSIECCYQNVGIATSLALTMFEGNDLNEAMGVPFFYGLIEAVLVGIYCVFAWKAGWTKAPANERLWIALSTSYEVKELKEKSPDGDHVMERDEDEEANCASFISIVALQPSESDCSVSADDDVNEPKTSFLCM